MTLDEDAAKVMSDWWKSQAGEMPSSGTAVDHDLNQLSSNIAAFGHRCAEAMREECAKVAEDKARAQWRSVKAKERYANLARAIRQVEIT